MDTVRILFVSEFFSMVLCIGVTQIRVPQIYGYLKYTVFLGKYTLIRDLDRLVSVNDRIFLAEDRMYSAEIVYDQARTEYFPDRIFRYQDRIFSKTVYFQGTYILLFNPDDDRPWLRTPLRKRYV